MYCLCLDVEITEVESLIVIRNYALHQIIGYWWIVSIFLYVHNSGSVCLSTINDNNCVQYFLNTETFLHALLLSHNRASP